MLRELTDFEKKQTILYETDEWKIVVKCTQKGNLCTCVYYRGMHLGFVNIGDFKTQQMFYNLNFPFMIELSKELKNERVK